MVSSALEAHFSRESRNLISDETAEDELGRSFFGFDLWMVVGLPRFAKKEPTFRSGGVAVSGGNEDDDEDQEEEDETVALEDSGL